MKVQRDLEHSMKTAKNYMRLAKASHVRDLLTTGVGLKFGQFEKWCAENCKKVSQQSIRRYMQLTKRSHVRDLLTTGVGLKFGQFEKWCAENCKNITRKTVQKYMSLANRGSHLLETGVGLRQAYIALGILKEDDLAPSETSVRGGVG